MVQRDGLPVVSPEDVWCDLASELGLDDLIVLGDQVVNRWTGVPEEQLRAAAERRGSAPGAPRMREALPELRTGSRSAMETRARLVFLRAGLPEPELNATVLSEQGEWLGECDFVWRRHRLIAEYEGDHHRTEAKQWHHDVGRQELFQDDGWRFVRVTKRDVFWANHRHDLVQRLANRLGVRVC